MPSFRYFRVRLAGYQVNWAKVGEAAAILAVLFAWIFDFRTVRYWQSHVAELEKNIHSFSITWAAMKLSYDQSNAAVRSVALRGEPYGIEDMHDRTWMSYEVRHLWTDYMLSVIEQLQIINATSTHVASLYRSDTAANVPKDARSLARLRESLYAALDEDSQRRSNLLAPRPIRPIQGDGSYIGLPLAPGFAVAANRMSASQAVAFNRELRDVASRAMQPLGTLLVELRQRSNDAANWYRWFYIGAAVALGLAKLAQAFEPKKAAPLTPSG